jgi:plastocyanin
VIATPVTDRASWKLPIESRETWVRPRQRGSVRIAKSGDTGIRVPVRASKTSHSLCAALAVFGWCVAAPLPATPLAVRVLNRDGRPLAGAVVTAEPETAADPATPVKAIMDQVNMAFVPDVLVIPLHSTVQFPNSDAVGHQVYSFSSARQFQLPLYRGKPYPPVQFDQPGVVTLGCNIHDNMLAYIVVTGAPHFGRTDKRGEWQANDVPGGRYRVRVWHPLLNEPIDLERTVDVTVDPVAVEFRLARSLRPAPHADRPRSWDY